MANERSIMFSTPPRPDWPPRPKPPLDLLREATSGQGWYPPETSQPPVGPNPTAADLITRNLVGREYQDPPSRIPYLSRLKELAIGTPDPGAYDPEAKGSWGREQLRRYLERYYLPHEAARGAGIGPGAGAVSAASVPGLAQAIGVSDMGDAQGPGDIVSGSLQFAGLTPLQNIVAQALRRSEPAMVKAVATTGAKLPMSLPEALRGRTLPGAPPIVEGPVPHVVQMAEQYAKDRGVDLTRQSAYGSADPRRGEAIAQAFDAMKHDPGDPKVKAAYDALASETMAQWDALQKGGAKISFIPPGGADPYPGGPREALKDLRENNHLWVFPTVAGYGEDAAKTIAAQAATNPMLRSTGVNVGGHDMLVNDAFRAVHDYFGHGMEGANFGARGEENAWRAHSRLFSPEAMPALTSETRGQNSWVNFGPYGAANRADPKNTVYADQKIGLMPGWTTRESGMPLGYRLQQGAGGVGALTALGLGGDTAPQPVAYPQLSPPQP